MTPRRLYEQFALLPDNADRSEGSSLSGRVGIDDLRAVVAHHTTRGVSVSAGVFGLVGVSRDYVLRRLADEFFLRRCGRLVERLRADHPGCLLEASVSIHKVWRVKHEAYGVAIHTIGVWPGDGMVYTLD